MEATATAEEARAFKGTGLGQFRTLVEVPGPPMEQTPAPETRWFKPGKVPAGADRKGFVVEGSYGRRAFFTECPILPAGFRIVEEVATVVAHPQRTVMLMPGAEAPQGAVVVGTWENTLRQPPAGSIEIRILKEPTPNGAWCIAHPGVPLPVSFSPGPCPKCVLEAIEAGWARLEKGADDKLRTAEAAPLTSSSGCEPGCTAPTSHARQDVRTLRNIREADLRRQRKARDVLEAAGVLPTLAGQA